MVWKFLGAAAVAYGIVLVLLFVFQDRLVYLPNVAGRDLVASPINYGLDYDDVRLEVGDGERIHGWWVPAEADRGTVLFSHGNAGNISHRMDSIRIFNSLGMNVLIYDYRGYGESTGRPSEQATYEDIEAVWNYLVGERSIDPGRIVLFGRSLGAAVSAWLAAREEPGGLILESTFTSVPELGQQIYWWLPVRLLSRIDYNTRERLEEISAPVLVVHSPDDEIIPFEHGKRLLDAAGDRGELLELSGDHNTGFLTDEEAYREGLGAFFSRHLPDGS